MTVDHEGAEPIYRQLARILREQIESGELAPNRPIPSELQLQQTYGVARGSARKAVDILVDEGIVTRVPGRGTYVVPPEDRPTT